MRKTFLLRLVVAALMGCGAWGLLAQIEKAPVAPPVTQQALNPAEMFMRVRTRTPNTPGILTVSESLPAEQSDEIINTDKDAVWTRVCGSVLYSDNWTENEAKIGVYAIPLSGGEFTPLCISNDLNANGSGFFKDNMYYCCTMVRNGIFVSYYNTKFNTSTWARSSKALSSAFTYATDYAADPVTGKVYGCARNNAPDVWYLVSVDVSGSVWEPSNIAILDVCVSGMAVDNEGQIYAVGTDGMFYHIHKSTGKMTKIGDTGIRPKYLSSACVDPTTGEFYYSTVLENGLSGLYTIDYATGEASLVRNYPHNEQVVGLYIPKPEAQDNAPAEAENFKVNCVPGALTGTITFDAPKTFYNGDPGTGKIKCLVKAGSTTLKQDSVEFGTTGYELEWKLTKPANTIFSVVFSNKDGGNGPTRKSTFWVGNDAPKAVTGVSLTRADNRFLLNWTAPAGSAHGGYCPEDEVTYIIVRYPDKKTVASAHVGTAFEDVVDAPSSITGFYYSVQANHAGQKATAVNSNTIILGDVTPPYHEEFTTNAPFYTYKVIDADGDGKSFKWRQFGPAKNGMASCDYNSSKRTGKNDWLISPAINMEGGKAYIIEFSVGTGTDFGEILRVGFSDEPTVEGMNKNILLDTTYFQSCIFTRARVVATPKTDGKYYFGIHACIPTCEYYLDIDNVDIYEALDPMTPDNVTDLLPVVKKDGTGVDLTFKAPSTSIVGTPLNSITKIEVLRDGTLIHVITSPTPGATLTYTDPLAHAVGRYKYEVKAYSAQEAGPTAEYTLRIEEGPFTETFTEYASLSCFTRFDMNNDHTQWDFYPYSSSNSLMRIYNNPENANDDWFISYPIWLKGGYYYDLSFMLGGTNNASQEITAAYGFAPTPEGMTTEFLPKTTFKAATLNQYTVNGALMVKEDGFYYFGFHATSPSCETSMTWMTLDNFKIGEGLSFAAPGKAQELKITPDIDGANEGIVSVKAPILSINGDTITDLTKIDLYRDNKLIHTFTEVAPDGQYIFKDVDMKTGERKYKVVCFNSAGEGLPLEVSQYMGINRPGVPENAIAVETNKPGEVMVSWDAPKADASGNPQKLDGVTYEVRSYHDRSFLDHTMESDATSAISTDWLTGDPQTLVYYYVYAKNQLGLSKGACITDILPLGPAYEGFYHENIYDGVPKYTYGQRSYLGASWLVVANDEFPDVTPPDGNGMFMARGQYINSHADLVTGRIKLEKDPVMEFYYFSISPEAANYMVVEVDDGTGNGFEEVGNVVNNTGTMEWNKASISLSKYSGKTVQIKIKAYIGSHIYLFLDDIRIYNKYDHNLAVMQAIGPKRGLAGENYIMSFQVENLGKKTADKWTANLLCNGKVVRSKEMSKALAPGESYAMSFSHQLAAGMGDTLIYAVRVDMESDMNQEDNTSTPVKVTVNDSGLPEPLNLTGKPLPEKGATLSWSAPDAQHLNTEPVTEDFENMDAWETEYFGRWTCVDVDGLKQGGINGVYLNGIQGKPGSYFVFDSSDKRFADSNGAYAANSGFKMMASMYIAEGYANDDWLISPRLNGQKQTITFYGRSASQQNPENFEFYYSKTDRYPDNFIKLGAKSYISPKWTKYTYEVPEGARYFAVRHVSTDKFMLLLDDFTFIPATYEISDAVLAGYIIYRDGEALNTTPHTGTSFVDNDAPEGHHTYRVTAMYDRGESRASNLISITTLDVNSLYNDNASVKVVPGHIVISRSSGMMISVVRPDGTIVYAGPGADFIDIPADRGVYIVSLGLRPVKVIVP